MARNVRNSPAGNGSVQPSEARSPQSPGTQGVDAVREWMNTSLDSLIGVASGLEQLHGLSGTVLSGWSKALTLCSQDVDAAKEAEQVMALPAQMINHQLEQMTRHLGKASQDLLEVQTQWGEQWRSQLANQLQRVGRPAAALAAVNGGLRPAPLAAIGQFQDEWLAMTQKWIEAVGAAIPAQGSSSAR